MSRPSPISILRDLLSARRQRDQLDDTRVAIEAEIETLTEQLLPCIADGATLFLSLDYPYREIVTVSRSGDDLDVTPMDIVGAYDLEWPTPDTAEDAEFGAKAEDVPSSLALIETEVR